MSQTTSLPGTAPAAAIDEDEAEAPRASGLVRLGLFLAFVGVILLEPSLPANTAFIDPVIFLLVGFGIVSMMRHRSPAVAGFGRAMPWIWLFLLGSFLGMSHVGITYWAIQSLARTLFAIITFFCIWQVIEVYRLERLAMKGLLVSAVVAASILSIPGYEWRGDGWFPNPNYAGHFGVASGFILFLASKQPWVRVVGLVCIAASIQASGSFGAIGMCAAMGTVVLVRSMQRHTAVLTVVLVGAAIMAALFISAPEDEVPDSGLANEEVTDSISSNRFDRTTEGRGEIWGNAINAWEKEPFGIGPNGYRHRRIFVDRGRALEIHSDPIGILVERGIIGLLGWMGFWVVMLKISRPGGLARVLIIGNLVQAMFRETIHYRHLWLMLALLLVLDHRDEQAALADAEASEPEDDDEEPVTYRQDGPPPVLI